MTNISFKKVNALPTSGYNVGDVFFVSGEKKIYVRTETGWEDYGASGGVTSLGGKTGDILLDTGADGSTRIGFEIETGIVAGVGTARTLVGKLPAMKTVNNNSLAGSGNIAVGDVTKAGTNTFSGKNTFPQSIYMDSGKMQLIANGSTFTFGELGKGNDVVLKCVGTPTSDNDAANKKYVDDKVAAAGGGTEPYYIDISTINEYGKTLTDTAFQELCNAVTAKRPIYGYSTSDDGETVVYPMICSVYSPESSDARAAGLSHASVTLMHLADGSLYYSYISAASVKSYEKIGLDKLNVFQFDNDSGRPICFQDANLNDVLYVENNEGESYDGPQLTVMKYNNNNGSGRHDAYRTDICGKGIQIGTCDNDSCDYTTVITAGEMYLNNSSVVTAKTIKSLLPIGTQVVSTTTTETISLSTGVTGAHRVILANTSGTKTVRLPAAPYDGETFEIIRIGGVAFTLINNEGKAMQKCTGTATVTSMTISQSGKYTCIYSASGSRWYVMRDDFVSF